jgi:hypothetical protein
MIKEKKLSDSTNNFSKQKYNKNLKKVIELLFLKKEQKVLEIPEIHIY